MKKLLTIALIIGIAGLAGCSSSNDAHSALKQAGYTEVQTHGHAWFNCSEDDAFATSFTAKGPSGEQVSGAVCSGWFKGKTIRLD